MAALLLGTAPAQTWTGAVSTQWDLGGNWSAGLPYQGTANAQLEGWGAGYTNVQPAFGWPVIDSDINTYWGIGRVRGPGPHLTQTGGTHEWPNGSGRSSRGITIYSRPGNEFPPFGGFSERPRPPVFGETNRRHPYYRWAGAGGDGWSQFWLLLHYR